MNILIRETGENSILKNQEERVDENAISADNYFIFFAIRSGSKKYWNRETEENTIVVEIKVYHVL